MPRDQLTETYHALACPVRIRILDTIKAGELNVTAMCESLGLTQPAISHHLKVMLAAGLVADRRSGKFIFYSVTPLAAEMLHDGRLTLARHNESKEGAAA